MKSQSLSRDMFIGDHLFDEVKGAALKAVSFAEIPKHPIRRVKVKITFYWK